MAHLEDPPVVGAARGSDRAGRLWGLEKQQPLGIDPGYDGPIDRDDDHNHHPDDYSHDDRDDDTIEHNPRPTGAERSVEP